MNLREQEEIQRIKLLMGYDTKNTLSENYNRIVKEVTKPKTKSIINEQNPPTLDVGTFPDRMTIGKGKELPVPTSSDNLSYLIIFLNANPDEIGPGKKYNYLWQDFLKKVKGANLQVLLDAREGALSDEKLKNTNLSAYDLGVSGGITPDLPNFNQAGFTGPATGVLDSQIYALRLNDYQKQIDTYNKLPEQAQLGQKVKIDPKTNKMAIKPIEPQTPRWDLLKKVQISTGGLASQNTANVLNSLDSYGKTANEVLSIYNTQEQDKNCPVSEDENDLFRAFINASYPQLAKLYDLYPPNDRRGTPYCSNSVKGVWNHPNTETVKALEKFTGQKYNNTFPNIPDAFEKFLNTVSLYSQFTNLRKNPNLLMMDPRKKRELENKRKSNDKVISGYALDNPRDIDKVYKDIEPRKGQRAQDFSQLRYDYKVAYSVVNTYSDSELQKILDNIDKSVLPDTSWTPEQMKQVADALNKTECIFKTEDEGNDFRFYVNTVYPKLAAKEVLDLGYPGKPCNSYINTAYNYVIPSGEPFAGKTIGQTYQDFSEFKNKKEYEKFQIDYIPTAKDNTSIATISPQDFEKMQRANGIANTIKQFNQEQYYENDKFNLIFGKERLLKAKQECPYKLEEFLEKIKSGEIYDEETGLAYGEYTLGPDGRPYMIKWNEEIPCDSEFWGEYGEQIRTGAMILSFVITLPFGGSLLFGAGIITRMFVAAALDAGVNLYSAHVNYKAGRIDEAKCDLVIAGISMLVDLIPSVSKTLTGNFDTWTEDLIEKKLIQKIKDKTIVDYKTFLNYVKTLPVAEQKVLRNVLSNKGLRDAIESIPSKPGSQMKKIGEYLGKRLSRAHNQSDWGLMGETILRNVGIKVPLTLSPMVVTYGPTLFAQLMGTYEKIYGMEPNQEFFDKFKQNYKKYFPNESFDEIADLIGENPKLLQQVIDNKEYQKYYVNQKYDNATTIINGKKVDLSDFISQERKKREEIRRQYEERQKQLKLSEEDKENIEMAKEFEEETGLNSVEKEEGVEGEIPK